MFSTNKTWTQRLSELEMALGINCFHYFNFRARDGAPGTWGSQGQATCSQSWMCPPRHTLPAPSPAPLRDCRVTDARPSVPLCGARGGSLAVGEETSSLLTAPQGDTPRPWKGREKLARLGSMGGNPGASPAPPSLPPGPQPRPGGRSTSSRAWPCSTTCGLQVPVSVPGRTCLGRTPDPPDRLACRPAS